MYIYRAMCEAEAERTLANGRPDFLRRFKWFSPNLAFIKARVQDGKFNNSKNKPERYTRLLMFKTDDIHKSDFVSNNEVQFDRRRNPKIILVKELYVVTRTTTTSVLK